MLMIDHDEGFSSPFMYQPNARMSYKKVCIINQYPQLGIIKQLEKKQPQPLFCKVKKKKKQKKFTLKERKCIKPKRFQHFLAHPFCFKIKI